MAEYEGDGSYEKLFKQIYAIREYTSIKITIPKLDIDILKSSLLLRDFFGSVFSGILLSGKTYYLTNNYLGYYAKTSIGMYPYPMQVASNPTIRYSLASDKGSGFSVRRVAKSLN